MNKLDGWFCLLVVLTAGCVVEQTPNQEAEQVAARDFEAAFEILNSHRRTSPTPASPPVSSPTFLLQSIKICLL